MPVCRIMGGVTYVCVGCNYTTTKGGSAAYVRRVCKSGKGVLHVCVWRGLSTSKVRVDSRCIHIGSVCVLGGDKCVCVCVRMRRCNAHVQYLGCQYSGRKEVLYLLVGGIGFVGCHLHS